tara:strand:+ start:9080 stop:9925 length:846 start_codon:yes stop_codon:yes gene_type:complete
MNYKKNVLTIAGSDSSGGAGIQADIKTFEALNVYSASVITSITAQNTLGVHSVFDLPAKLISEQLDAVFSDIKISAVKIGMLKQPDYINLISKKLSHLGLINIVLDPVMVSTSGHSLIDEGAKETLTTKLFPLTDLITPNIPEAATLLKRDASWLEQNLQLACQQMLESFKLKAVLIKGGHMRGKECIDTLATKDSETQHIQFRTFTYKKIDTVNSHGTGCSLSSAITAYLAQGQSLEHAVELAGYFLQKALQDSNLQAVGKGHGPINHRSGSSTYLLNGQ